LIDDRDRADAIADWLRSTGIYEFVRVEAAAIDRARVSTEM